MTKCYFPESRSFIRYSSKNMEIQCLQHKTRDESDALPLNVRPKDFIVFYFYFFE